MHSPKLSHLNSHIGSTFLPNDLNMLAAYLFTAMKKTYPSMLVSSSLFLVLLWCDWLIQYLDEYS